MREKIRLEQRKSFVFFSCIHAIGKMKEKRGEYMKKHKQGK